MTVEEAAAAVEEGKSEEMQITLAIGAKALFEDPVFRVAFGRLMTRTLTTWRNMTDPAKREQCWHFAKAIEELEGEMRGMVNAGHMLKGKTLET
jgi:hypothetical protein